MQTSISEVDFWKSSLQEEPTYVNIVFRVVWYWTEEVLEQRTMMTRVTSVRTVTPVRDEPQMCQCVYTAVI